MIDHLMVLPVEIQQKFGAQLYKAPPGVAAWRLIGMQITEGGSGQGQRITVRLLNEDDDPQIGVPVAFAFDTGPQIIINPHITYYPPPILYRGDLLYTSGDGQTDHIQGSEVKPGQPGGVTVLILDPQHPADYVTGAGMLANHDGLFLTYVLDIPGINSDEERLTDLEARVAALEAA